MAIEALLLCNPKHVKRRHECAEVRAHTINDAIVVAYPALEPVDKMTLLRSNTQEFDVDGLRSDYGMTAPQAPNAADENSDAGWHRRRSRQHFGVPPGGAPPGGAR